MGRKKLDLTHRICVDCETYKEITEFRSGHRRCNVCINLKQVEYRKNNLDKVKVIKKQWRENNKDKENERTKKWRDNLTDDQIEEQRIKRNDYLKNKRKTDPNFVMKEAMHRMLTRTLKFKTDRTSKLLGYSALELKQHIESLFTEGMSWDNRSEWHIDHIRPISSFQIDTPPNVINALSNLQPLWVEENLIKSNKY